MTIEDGSSRPHPSSVNSGDMGNSLVFETMQEVDLMVFGPRPDSPDQVATSSHYEEGRPEDLDILTGHGAEVPAQENPELLNRYEVMQPKKSEPAGPLPTTLKSPEGGKQTNTPVSDLGEQPARAHPRQAMPPVLGINAAKGSPVRQKDPIRLPQGRAPVSFNPSTCYVAAMQRYRCPFQNCNKSFESANGVARHVTSASHRRKEFQCPGCYRWYDSKLALAQHCISSTQRCSVGKYTYQSFYTQLIAEVCQAGAACPQDRQVVNALRRHMQGGGGNSLGETSSESSRAQQLW